MKGDFGGLVWVMYVYRYRRATKLDKPCKQSYTCTNVPICIQTRQPTRHPETHLVEVGEVLLLRREVRLEGYHLYKCMCVYIFI